MADNAKKMGFHEALKQVLTENEGLGLKPGDDQEIIFTSDFKSIKKDDKQIVSKITAMTYEKLGVAKKAK